MLPRYHWVDFRVLGILVVLFAACGYDPPSVGSAASSSSASSSSGMGGAGGAEQSSSASSGLGGIGGLPNQVGGSGGIGGGTGGIGGIPLSSSSSSSGSAGGGVGGGMNPPKTVVQNCGQNGDCETSGFTVCCKSEDGTTASCEELTLCALPSYGLKCDDRADCGEAYCCLGSYRRTTCQAFCPAYNAVCKTDADCPPNWQCLAENGPLRICKAP